MDVSNEKRKSILWVLIKIKLIEMLRGSNAKRGVKPTKKKIAKKALGTTALVILYIISFVLIAVSLGAFFALIMITTIGRSFSWVYFAYMAIGMFLLIFIGSIFMTENQMFQAKDNERLVAMPIKPWEILISRMVSIIAFNFVLGLMVGLPAGIVYLYFKGFDFIKFIFYIVALIVIPFLALSVGMLAGWLLSLITSKVKNTKVIRLAIAVVAMILYFYFVMSDGGWVNNLANNSASNAAGIQKYILPAYSVAKAIHEKSFIHFILMILWHVVPFLLVSALVSRNFLKTITSGGGQTKFEYKSTGVHVRSLRSSFGRLELNRFFSSVTYIMNGALGLLLMVLMAFFSFSKDGTMSQITQALKMMGAPSQGVLPFAICASILGIMSLVIISSATISLEANTLWMIKSLPISGKDIILSKAYPHIIISLPFIIVTTIILQFRFDMSILERILVVLIPITATIFNALLGVRLNIKFPKFNWTNEAQAVKQGLSVILAMLFNALPVVIFSIGFGFIVFYKKLLTGSIYLLIMEGVYLALVLWMYLWTTRKGDKAIADLEN